MSNEEIYTMEVDPGVEAPELSDALNDDNRSIEEYVDETEETEAKEVIRFDLFNGTSLMMDPSSTNWDEIYDQIPPLMDTVLQLKKIFRDIMSMEISKRDAELPRVYEDLKDLQNSIGINEMHLDLRDDITEYEKVLLMIVNTTAIIEGMIHTAEITKCNQINHTLDAMIGAMHGEDLSDEMIEEYTKVLDSISHEINDTEIVDGEIVDEVDEVKEENDD